MGTTYNFNISLSVLNHLGRNLYRNIITVIGEAISNAWDADAENVWIRIDRDKNTMCILDDGIGMTSEDFQEKFLKIGYSKRRDGQYKSSKGRPYIGRKGIGKLALLSCANRIHIATKSEEGEIVGGIIDNSGLDEAIKDDINSQDYILAPLENDFTKEFSSVKHGTIILFDSVSNGIYNTVDYIKKAVALYFRFALIDPTFNIFVQDDLINEKQLSDFSENTQFLWTIGDISDPYLRTLSNLEKKESITPEISVAGYVATVKKPSQLKIRGTQEKATIDLFVNGRLREKDILRHIPSSRIVENYVYGQIHFNDLDDGKKKDVFTSSREGVVSNDSTYKELLKEVKRIFNTIIIPQWDVFRRECGNDGDPDNKSITPKARKAQELFNATMQDMQSDEKFIKKGSLVEEWAKKLAQEAQFNVPSYTECFISENLLRQYVDYSKMTITKEAKDEADKWRDRESNNKEAANISFDIRTTDGDLYYLDMKYLANLIDKADNPKTAGLSRSSTMYKPMRDAVGHTSLLTDTAKKQLSIEYENIKARLAKLLKDIENQPND
ncbi:MAG: ATP-binding protein [Ruminococcus sp.]|nr:ATP-binding protein [Ruminococcus sp.]